MDDWLTLAEVEKDPEFASTGIKAATLRWRLNRGQIEGKLRGKTWFVSRQTVRDFLKVQADPHKPGPKMKVNPDTKHE